tara:strand:- start:2384 stop:3727 length:1344 start_codon:yes stop_codon:yes gene_type:complete
MKKTFINIALIITLGVSAICISSCKKEDPESATEQVQIEGTIDVSSSTEGVGTVTWTKDKTYVLTGFVYVNEGQTLTIEKGTIIKGAYGTGASSSALIIAQGGKIMAEGTAEEPIIFTSIADNIAYNEAGNLIDSDNLKPTDQGLWGGLIVLGKALTNTVPSVQNIEGIPTTETRGQYGGPDDNDNSGILKYISIRHGGSNIGADNEINGLSLGAVGDGTTIEHIEVYANSDDGIEFFGGTVGVKYAVVSYCGDDSFDYDQGWRGKGQFWVTIQGEDSGNRAGEHDGGTNPETGMPYATPEIRNATYIGNGKERCLTFRDNAGGKYINSIFQGWDKGIDVEDLAGNGDSRQRLDDGDLIIQDNVFYNIASGTTINDLIVSSESEDISTHANVTGNEVTNPGISVTNPVPTATLATGAASADTWFENVTYKGAFQESNWAKNWTKLFQ